MTPNEQDAHNERMTLVTRNGLTREREAEGERLTDFDGPVGWRGEQRG